MKVNFMEKQIVLSAKELKNASTPYTKEYRDLIDLMRELPGFRIMVRRPHICRNANRGLTYNVMESYIEQNAPELLDDFRQLCVSFSYPAVSKWFRNQFPGFCNTAAFANSFELAA